MLHHPFSSWMHLLHPLGPLLTRTRDAWTTKSLDGGRIIWATLQRNRSLGIYFARELKACRGIFALSNDGTLVHYYMIPFSPASTDPPR